MPITHREGLTSLFDLTFYPFQFSKAYADFIKHYFGNEVVYFEKNKTITPLQITGRSIFKQVKLLAPPYCSEKEIVGEQLQTYLNELQTALQNSGEYIRITQAHPMAFTSEKPTNSNYCVFGTYITDLQNHADDILLNSFDPKYKKAIQHSIKNGGTVNISNNLISEFYTIYKKTCKRANIYYDQLHYFEQLISHLPNNTITAIIYDDENKSVGAAFFLFDESKCYCTHAGSIPGSKLYGGMKYLHFEMMKWMRNNNVKNYDLTGVRINSSNETLQGIFKFKKGFGGTLKQGYLWKSDLIKWKCYLYDTLIMIKSKGKKNYDIIDQEQ